MKKITVTITAMLLMSIYILPTIQPAYSASSNLIENVTLYLTTTSTPTRLEILFDLKEPIDLTAKSSDIIYEYLMKDNGNYISVYTKDKTWAGYLNSYSDYPTGQQKYSSGTEKGDYPDYVPNTTLYTTVKTSTSIDVTALDAVRVTVIRPEGTGKSVTVNMAGEVIDTENIILSKVEQDENTGIVLETTAAELPLNSALVAEEVTGGYYYEMANIIFDEAKNIKVHRITLESEGVEIQPSGYIKINIPIPNDYDLSSINVYRLEADGTRIQYPTEVVRRDNINYASFETDHLSIYLLTDYDDNDTPVSNTTDETETVTETAEETITETTEEIAEITIDENLTGAEGEEETVTEENIITENPKTGPAQPINLAINAAIASAITSFILFKKKLSNR